MVIMHVILDEHTWIWICQNKLRKFNKYLFKLNKCDKQLFKLANMIDNSSKIANLISIYSNFKRGIDLIELFNFVTIKFCKCETHLMNFPNGFCPFAQTIKILKLG